MIAYVGRIGGGKTDCAQFLFRLLSFFDCIVFFFFFTLSATIFRAACGGGARGEGRVF